MKEATAAVLLLLALAVGAWSRLAREVAGLDPLAEPSLAELDAPPEPDDREAPRFLAERDRVELVVPRDMTVGELLRVYQVDFPHVLRQLAAQEGVETLSREHVIRAGARYEITPLTPQAEDVP